MLLLKDYKTDFFYGKIQTHTNLQHFKCTLAKPKIWSVKNVLH